MRERVALAVVIVAIVIVGLGFWLVGPRKTPSGTGTQIGAQDEALIARGRYLATLGDCEACHTDRSRNGAPYAGGVAVETPFGNIVAPNITPDRTTGVGAWSDAEFDAAMRLGIKPKGAHLYPAMPYPFYARMNNDDSKAIRAYLNTIEPIDNAVVANQLPFPFNIRELMWGWNLIYFSPDIYKPDNTKSSEWNRGAFLVEGPGHCGACHTPKTWLGGDDSSHVLQGARLQGWFAPDITNNSDRGLGRWSIDDIVRYLRTGHNRFTAATGSMAEEVSDSTSKISDDDLAAIAVFLKGVPHGEDRRQALASDDPAMRAGEAIYVDSCSACHAMNGKGSPYLFPSLAQSSNVQSKDPASLIRIVLRGARSVATKEEPTAPGMPSYSWQLSDQEVADVLTYIRNSWGAHAAPVSVGEVRAARTSLATRAD
jgi:mono/diheme cytochrome c family protein